MGHPHDKLFDVDLGAGPARSAPLQKRPFLRNEFPMPA
jgi:hypothetical protein